MDKNKVEKEYTDVLNIVTGGIDTFINKYENTDIDIKYMQKLQTVSAILEFLKAGADIRPLPLQGNRVPFIIELKGE